MRSKERLMEMIETVGDGAGQGAIVVLRAAAAVIEGEVKPERLVTAMLSLLFSGHPSPHIRELASEALLYVELVTPPEEQAALWNRQIRDRVDAILAERGFAADSSARNLLASMNFDGIVKTEGRA